MADDVQYKVGDMLLLSNDREGEIKYIGTVDGLQENVVYYGIELTDGQSAGDNSGSVNDKSYFECEVNRGLFLASNSNEIRRLLREKDFDNPRRRRNLSMKSLADLTKNSDQYGDVSPESALNAELNSGDSDEKAGLADNNSKNNMEAPSLAGTKGNMSNLSATTESGRQFQEQFNKQMNGMTEEEIISICPFILVGRGVAGIDEMRESMDDSKIYFGLLQIQIGSGHFARYKNIFIHFNGEKHPKPLQRAKINRKLPKAKEVIGHCHAPLVVTSKDSFQVDWVFNSVKGIFVADDIDTGKGPAKKRVDLNTLKQDYKSLMEKAALEAEKARIRLEEERKKMEEEMRLKAQREEEERLARIAKEEEEKRKALEEAERQRKEAELAEKRRLKEERDKKRREEEAKRAQSEEKDSDNKSNENGNTNSNNSNKNGTNGNGNSNNNSSGNNKGGKKKKKRRRRRKKKKDDWSNDRPWTAERVLAAVHAEMSPFNWAIFSPNNGKKPLKCQHWGHGSIANLREYLSEDSVQYGIMRLAFGSGRFRRSHFVFFLWTPDAMTQKAGSSNARSKSNKSRMLHVSWQPHMQKLLSPFNVTVVAESLDKVTVDEWINRVKKNVVIDGDSELNAEALKKALEEEEAWLAKLRKKQEEDEKKRREYEEQQKIEQAQKQKERLLAEKEKSAQNASEITNVRLKTPKAGKKKHSLDVASDFEDGDMTDGMTDVTDSEYYDETANEDGSDNNENNNDYNDDDLNLDEPVVVQLSPEELERLAQERRLAEIEEKKKQAQRAKILEEAMHSRLCLESVELVKRESEQMCWVLIQPRI